MKKLIYLVFTLFICLLLFTNTVKAQNIEVAETCFDPCDNGWKFTNDFPYHFIIRALGNDFVSNKSVGAGLCGGMCFAAIDKYYQGEPIPKQTNSPEIDEPLTNYLTNRQQSSVKSGGIAIKVLDWIVRPDQAHWNRRHSVGYLTKQEIKKVKEKLNNGKPVTLVLVRGKGIFELGAVANAHQVVAYKYEDNKDKKIAKFWVYDPNRPVLYPSHPSRNNYIQVQYGFDNNKIIVSTNYYGDKYKERGFFINHYDKESAPSKTVNYVCGNQRFASAKQTLIASANNCNSGVSTDRTSYWYSGNEIKFKPGFSAIQGTNFTAYINDCHASNSSNLQEENISRNTVNKSNDEEIFSNEKGTILKNFKVFPNPIYNHANISFSSKEESIGHFFLYNATGQMIYQREIFIYEGENNIPYNTNETLPVGIYFFQLRVKDKVHTKSVVFAN